MSLLVSAGEASGDAMAAPVVRQLGAGLAFGLGGSELRAAGMDTSLDLEPLAAMGVGSVALRAPAIARALAHLLAEAKRRRPRASLLVGFSEFNAWLGPRLRELGVRVLWYAPPQIWAWRKERGPRLCRAVDRMAVLLPFEAPLWQGFGADAHFVGHPVLDRALPTRQAARDRFGLTPWAEYVALLPGSRVQEVEHHLGPMLEALALLRAERGALDARVVVAPSLPASVREKMTRTARDSGVGVISSHAQAVLPAFDVAMAKSGTVTLECVSAGVPPVIGYRTGRLSAWLAERMLNVKFVGLPNLILGEGVFPELLQERFTADALAEETARLLDERRRYVEACADVRRALAGGERRASDRVVELLEPWLA